MSNSIVVYSYSRCSTCRKALAWLQEHHIAYELLDIIETPPNREMLVGASERLGNRKLLFNTSGQSYRALGSAVVQAMSDTEAFDALADDGKLIKRPLLITEKGNVLVGFKPEVWAEVLLDKD
ncbi:MAG: arsenate reductase family protein [Prochlorococcus sp.]